MQCPLWSANKMLSQVDAFNYLQVLVTSEGKEDEETDRQIGDVLWWRSSQAWKQSCQFTINLCPYPHSIVIN